MVCQLEEEERPGGATPRGCVWFIVSMARDDGEKPERKVMK